MLCEYGCGREAKFLLKSGKHCCCDNFQSCSAIIAKNSASLIKKKKFEICKLPDIISGNFVCEFCNRHHDGSYKNQRFCSLYCSKRYPLTFRKRFKPSTKTHILKCVQCGKEVEASIVVNKVRCNDCRHPACRVCGERHLKITEDACYHKMIIPTLIKYFGFDETKLGSKDAIIEYKRIQNLISDLYHNQEKSIDELMQIFNYKSKNHMNFSKILNTLGIKRRNLSDSIINSIKHNRRNIPTNIKYKTGHHTSWEGKKFWYRSSYELDYAKELDEKKIRYEVESFRIPYLKSTDNKTHIAIPDFYLIDSNTLVEVKSTFTYNEQDIFDKFSEYLNLGYNIKLMYEHIDIPIQINPLVLNVPTWEELQQQKIILPTN